MINEANVSGAIESYEKAWKLWNEVFSRFPAMISEELGDDLVKSLGRYKRLIDEDLDEKFILHEILEFRKAKDEGSGGGSGIDFFKKTEELNIRAQALLEAESRGETKPSQESIVSPKVPAEPNKSAETNAEKNESPPLFNNEFTSSCQIKRRLLSSTDQR